MQVHSIKKWGSLACLILAPIIIAARVCGPISTPPPPPPSSGQCVTHGTITQLNPSNIGSLSSITSGNTGQLASGTYSGFTIPAGVTVFGPLTGPAAIITSDVTLNSNSTLCGTTLNSALTQVGGTVGATVTRNIFNNGHDIGDGFGAGAIKITSSNGGSFDHNLVNNVGGVAIYGADFDNFTATRNDFENPRQPASWDWFTAGHGNATFSFNVIINVTRAGIETGNGGGSTVINGVSVHDNYLDTNAFNTVDAQLAYSMVGNIHGLQVFNNFAHNSTNPCNGSTCGIGVEALGDSTSPGSSIHDNDLRGFSWGGIGYDCPQTWTNNNIVLSTIIPFTAVLNNAGCSPFTVTGTTSNNGPFPPKPSVGPTAP